LDASQTKAVTPVADC